MADHMIVASGRSNRQVISAAQNIADKIKSKFNIISRTEGKEQGDWVLIDSGDVIIHIFRPEVREFYQLEKMWLSDKIDESYNNAHPHMCNWAYAKWPQSLSLRRLSKKIQSKWKTIRF